MKVRHALVLALSLLAAACSPGGTEKEIFTEAALKGAEGRAEVRRYKEEQGLVDPNLRFLSAEAYVSHDVERAKLRPTALTILKKLRERFEKNRWIVLRIYDDDRAARMLLPVVTVELKDGKVALSGFAPSAQEVEAAAKEPRSLARTVGADPRLVFTRPAEEDMNIAQDADARAVKKGLKKWGRPAGWEGPVLSPEAEAKRWSYREDPAVEAETGGALNVEPLRVRVARYNVYMYYAGYAKGREP